MILSYGATQYAQIEKKTGLALAEVYIGHQTCKVLSVQLILVTRMFVQRR